MSVSKQSRFPLQTNPRSLIQLATYSWLGSLKSTLQCSYNVSDTIYWIGPLRLNCRASFQKCDICCFQNMTPCSAQESQIFQRIFPVFNLNEWCLVLVFRNCWTVSWQGFLSAPTQIYSNILACCIVQGMNPALFSRPKNINKRKKKPRGTHLKERKIPFSYF